MEAPFSAILSGQPPTRCKRHVVLGDTAAYAARKSVKKPSVRHTVGTHQTDSVGTTSYTIKKIAMANARE
jgi:hypothetical protein